MVDFLLDLVITNSESLNEYNRPVGQEPATILTPAGLSSQ